MVLDLSNIPDVKEGDDVCIEFDSESCDMLDASLPVPVTLHGEAPAASLEHL